VSCLEKPLQFVLLSSPKDRMLKTATTGQWTNNCQLKISARIEMDRLAKRLTFAAPFRPEMVWKTVRDV